MFLKIKKEINDLSFWFKIVLSLTLLVYLAFWVFTVYYSGVQRDKNFEILLPAVADDSIEYKLLSDSLINDGEFLIYGKVETHRSPGYPLFISVVKTIGRSYFAVTLVQIFLVFASVLIVRRIGIHFSSKLVGEIAGTLLLVNPVTITLSLLILTDVLFLFLFVLGFYLAITLDEKSPYKKIFIISVIFTYAIYVRSMGIFVLPIFLVPVLASKLPLKFQLKLMGAMVVFTLLLITPWVIRNYLKVGVVRFNSVESVNLSWMVPQFLSRVKGTPEIDEINAFHKATGIPEESWPNREFYDIKYSKQINDVAKKIILERPFSYIKFQIITSLPFLFPSSILFARDVIDSVTGYNRPFQYGTIHFLASGEYKLFIKGALEVWWKFAERLLWLLLYFISLFAVWKRRNNSLVWIFIFISLYLMLLSGPAAGPRLTFQAWPYMFILIALGVVDFYERIILWKNTKND